LYIGAAKVEAKHPCLFTLSCYELFKLITHSSFTVKGSLLTGYQQHNPHQLFK